MKLRKFDFYLDWPISIEVINLRKYITTSLMKKGKVIRWSIIDIQNSMEDLPTKKLRIKAILLD